jgi:uncharacterized protein
MLVQVKVERVTLDTATSRFVVILKDEKQNRWLPIVVGSTEAQAIALQLENISPPRPLTHDLLKNVLNTIKTNINRIVVNDLRENTYFALIEIQKNGDSTDIDARPSDAIAIALRMQAPIFVDESVMQKAGITDKDATHDDIPTEAELTPGDLLEELNLKLLKAVEDERYEDAAKIRDEIQSLKSSMRSKAD